MPDQIHQFRVKITGDDAESWVGYYGVIFENISLRLELGDPIYTLMSAKDTTETNLGQGFMASFGTSAAILSMAAYALYEGESTFIESDDFQRVV